MKKLLSAFLAAVLLLGTLFAVGCSETTHTSSQQSTTEPTKKQLRVGTYNIKHGADVSDSDGVAGADADENSLRAIAEDIKSLELDIVGLQEVDNLVARSGFANQLALLSEYTGLEYTYYIRAVEWDSNEYSTAGSAILSKYPIIPGESSTIELSRGNTWDQVRKLGHVQIDVEGTVINFFNTHLTPLDLEMRTGEFAKIAEATKDKEYCILTGDFNCPSFDEFKVLENLTNFNCDERKFITYPVDQKFMDNICYSDEFKPVKDSGGVLENGNSDHSLLWAEFEYTPAAEKTVKEHTLQVASYNVAGGSEVGKDLRVIADDILEQELDIIGFQEVDYNASRNNYTDMMKLFSQYTGYKYYTFFEALDLSFYEGHTGSYGVGILSKYPIANTEKIVINPGDKATFIESRVLARAEINVLGTKVNFFTTHLTIRDDNDRKEEFKLVAEKTKQYKNVILTGDFNNDNINEFDALSHLSMINSKKTPYITYPKDKRTIDNVLFSSEFTLVKGSEGMRENKHSDHYMLYADLKYSVG